jgi:hypothetical protein
MENLVKGVARELVVGIAGEPVVGIAGELLRNLLPAPRISSTVRETRWDVGGEATTPLELCSTTAPFR